MTKLIKYLSPYKPVVALTLLLLLGQAIAELYLPFLMTDIVNIGIIEGQTEHIWQIGMFMLVIAFLSGVASIASGYLAPRIAAGFARDLRRDLFIKVEGFSQHEFDRFSSASLITRCTNDVTQVQTLVNLAGRMLCYAPLMGIGGIIMAVNQSVSMSWIIALAVICLIGLVVSIASIVLPKIKIVQKLIDSLNRVSREILTGLMVIRAFGTQSHEQKRFAKVNQDLADTGLYIGRVMAIALPALMLLMNVTAMLVIWVGSQYVAEGALQIGDMMAFMQYAMRIIIAFMMVSMMIIFVPRAQVSAERILEVLNAEESINDPISNEIETFHPNKKGVVEFHNVRFRYQGAEVDALEGISFTALPGQTTAIIGATGAGKSTIANLLLRFYDISGGNILVEGVDIRKVRQADLREKIGYVPQKSQLIKGTISSNIRYGREDGDADETEDIVKEAATIAQALSFIEEKPEQFEAEIAQGGANVSGGQRQRISIARALAKVANSTNEANATEKSGILVFDDSFSALDFQTDAKLREALSEHTGEATVIIIAQRVGTIMNAEQILVLDAGKIVGRGTHKELLESCPTYYEIASSQLAEGAENV